MRAEKEKDENKVVENFEELDDAEIKLLIEDQKRHLKVAHN